MSSEFTLKIKLSNDNTYNMLKANRRNLVLMKAVSSASGEAMNARPLAWVCLDPDHYGKEITVKWKNEYKVFTSTDQIISGAQISVANPYPIKLGQSLIVENANGSGKVQDGGLTGSVFISNSRPRQPSELPLTCGLMQTVEDPQKGSITSQLCAFPLLAKSAEIISPINKVYVTFTSYIQKVGAVVESSIHTGVMLTYLSETSREVTFDIDKGFSYDHEEGSETVEATWELAKKLVVVQNNLMNLRVNFETDIKIREHEKAKMEDLKKFSGMTI